MVDVQEYIDKKYPINGVYKSSSDKENKGKKREEIINLDLSKRKVGKGFFNDGKILEGSLKLEGFTNLQTLIISSQQISNLDLSDCPKLEEVDINDCLKLTEDKIVSSLVLNAEKNKLVRTKRVNAQEWLDKWYPQEGCLREGHNFNKKRSEIKWLDISKQNLESSLDLSDFISLWYLNCANNQLTSLDLSNCL
jgi:Leucine-rich repeat (LRR) protein